MDSFQRALVHWAWAPLGHIRHQAGIVWAADVLQLHPHAICNPWVAPRPSKLVLETALRLSGMHFELLQR